MGIPINCCCCFVNTYSLDNDLSNGQCYPSFEQPRPGVDLLRLNTLSGTPPTPGTWAYCENNSRGYM